MKRDRKGDRGFTLIETIVVITIIGILTTLTLIGVQAARQSARRVNCVNNLSQMGRGLSGYIAVKGSFPKDGYLSGYSFLVELLPYLEQKNIYNTINFQVDALNFLVVSENVQLKSVVLPWLICPSDRLAGGALLTNYAGNRGVGVQKFGYNGAFVMQREPSDMGIFVDGTSQTIAIAEWSLGAASSLDRDPKRTVFATPIPLTEASEFDLFRNLCHGLDVKTARLSGEGKGFNWVLGEFGRTLYNHTLPPNDLSCLNRTAVQKGAWTAGSQHPGGGLNVLYVDGHVSWIRESVSRAVWAALGSRDGGEVTDRLGSP